MQKDADKMNKSKTLRVLSTGMGVALAAHIAIAAVPPVLAAERNTASVHAAGTEMQQGEPDAQEPQLLEASTESVKRYFDPEADWNIPFPIQETGEKDAENNQGQEAGSGGTDANNPAIINHGGFGWDDLLLYHMIFNAARPYSSTTYHSGHPTVYPNNPGQPFKPKTYDSGQFMNKPTANSAVRPKTSYSSGNFSQKSSSAASKIKSGASGASTSGTYRTSAPRGSVGGVSGGFTSKGFSFGG